MPAAARDSGTDSVDTVHPAAGKDCEKRPITIATDQGSGNVFVNGDGAVRVGDNCERHPFPSCSQHATPLVVGSGTVRVNNQPMGREGDTYACGATITSGSGNVNVGG